MLEVSKAINILDTSRATDKGICGSKWVNGSGYVTTEEDNKCTSVPQKNDVASTFTKLSDMFTGNETSRSGNDIRRKYPDDVYTKMSEYPKTSATISKDVSNLTRDQHGVVSSAFAKAHEGAEIVIAVDIHQ